MTNIVLLGGNGYIGRYTTENWLEKDKTANFYVISRSGNNKLKHPNLYNYQADVTDYQAVKKLLPAKIDYIIDFIGRPEKDAAKFKQVNNLPAEVMLKIAKEKQVKAMGFIGGQLGPKSFLEGKQKIGRQLQASGIPAVIVEPTVVYGGDRSDALAKLIPVFKVLGLFAKNMKPVHIDQVSNEMISKMTAIN